MSWDVDMAVEAANQVGEIFRVGKISLPTLSREQRQEEQFQKAFSSFNAALQETVTYMQQLEKGVPYSQDKERGISDLWCRAANAMAPIDADLSNRCLIKGNGWLDPKIWQDPEFKNKITINKMRRDFLDWNSRQPRGSVIPAWVPIAGVGFAVLTALSLFYFLVGPELPPGRKVIFDTWVAFCVACSGAFLGGEAAAKGKIPLPIFKDHRCNSQR